MPKARDPRTDRRPVRLIDQHGRAYTASIDIRSGAPTGLIDPLWVHQNGYSVPSYLVPPLAYVKFYGDERPGEVYVDYNGWLADLKAGWQQYRTNTRDVEMKVRGDKADSDNPSPTTREIVGPHPQAIQLVLAMKQGNKWALGLSAKRPAWADQYVPLDALVIDEEFPDVIEDESAAPDEGAPAFPGAPRKGGRPKGSTTSHKSKGRRPVVRRQIAEPDFEPVGAIQE